MDEIFDSSLDTQGGDELIKIMQGIIGDSNIVVISHKTDQMIDKFDHVIRFEKVKNFSRKVE
jgi:energy-coupling factor transporter ATP-binding protein EcfA2